MWRLELAVMKVMEEVVERVATAEEAGEAAGEAGGPTWLCLCVKTGAGSVSEAGIRAYFGTALLRTRRFSQRSRWGLEFRSEAAALAALGPLCGVPGLPTQGALHRLPGGEARLGLMPGFTGAQTDSPALRRLRDEARQIQQPIKARKAEKRARKAANVAKDAQNRAKRATKAKKPRPGSSAGGMTGANTVPLGAGPERPPASPVRCPPEQPCSLAWDQCKPEPKKEPSRTGFVERFV